METSKRSHEAPMAFNVVIWKGVLMPEVKEPIRVWQQHINAKSFAPTMDIRHANSLESNSIVMTQEVGIQFLARFARHLFYLGKSLFACNRWNHGKLKTQVWCTTGKFTMGKAIYRGVCNRTYWYHCFVALLLLSSPSLFLKLTIVAHLTGWNKKMAG